MLVLQDVEETKYEYDQCVIGGMVNWVITEHILKSGFWILYFFFVCLAEEEISNVGCSLIGKNNLVKVHLLFQQLFMGTYSVPGSVLRYISKQNKHLWPYGTYSLMGKTIKR